MSAWSGLGMCYANDINGSGTFSEAQVTADLTYLKSYGVNKIRIAAADFLVSAGITRTRQAAVVSVSLDLYTIFGISAGWTTLTSANWADYATEVAAQATWAQANGIDEFQLGNELEGAHDGSLTHTDIRNNLRTLATAVQAIFTNGPVSYSVGQSTAAAEWIADGNRGDIDKLSLTCYGYLGSRSDFLNEMTNWFNAWGADHGFLSEWNIDHRWEYYTKGEDWECSEIATRLELVKDSGFTSAYFHCWRMTSDTFATQKINGDKRLWWNALSTNGKRRWFI